MVEREDRKSKIEVKRKECGRRKSLLMVANNDAYVALNNRHTRTTPDKSIAIFDGSNRVRHLWN